MSREFQFTPEETIEELQHGEITDHSLSPEEFKLIDAVVNWQDPRRFAGDIYSVSGRSIVFRSPTAQISDPRDYFHGKFDGLQLIGAGGDAKMAHTGIIQISDPIRIRSVDDRNHVSEFADIIQQRTIDNTGQLQFWDKQYMARGGMDLQEADNRKLVTSFFNELLDPYRNDKLTPSFTIPVLAAEGFFHNKKDLHGVPLRFQVYRVPLLPRFAQQVFDIGRETKLENAFNFIRDYGFVFGSTLATVHDEKKAYMHGHVDNSSYIALEKNGGLYITDLGSMKDVSQEVYSIRYYALDVYCYFESMRIALTNIVEWNTEQGYYTFVKGTTDYLIFDMLKHAAMGFSARYFDHDLWKDPKRWKSVGNDLLESFFIHNAPQDFLEFFEQFKQSNFQ